MYHTNLFDTGFKSAACRDATASVAVAVMLKTFRDRYGHLPSDAATVKVYRGETLTLACTLGAYLRSID